MSSSIFFYFLPNQKTVIASSKYLLILLVLLYLNQYMYLVPSLWFFSRRCISFSSALGTALVSCSCLYFCCLHGNFNTWLFLIERREHLHSARCEFEVTKVSWLLTFDVQACQLLFWTDLTPGTASALISEDVLTWSSLQAAWLTMLTFSCGRNLPTGILATHLQYSLQYFSLKINNTFSLLLSFIHGQFWRG